MQSFKKPPNLNLVGGREDMPAQYLWRRGICADDWSIEKCVQSLDIYTCIMMREKPMPVCHNSNLH